MKFDPVTPELKRIVGVVLHPLINQQFGYVRLAAPLLDLAGISTEFCGWISAQFCFTTSLFAPMLQVLHARLCLFRAMGIVSGVDDIPRMGLLYGSFCGGHKGWVL